MKIGVSTACLYPLLTEKSLEEVGKSGIKDTEIFFNAISELKKDFVCELKRIKDHYGLNILSVHPTMSLAESFMFFSAYDRRKEEGLEDFRRYGEIASYLGAEYVILHGGKLNGILNDYEYFERFNEIARAVSENGGTLLQENVAKFRANDPLFLKKMSDYLGKDAQFCLDIKQCVRGGYSPLRAIELLKGSVKHIHLSDHSPKKDCMIPYKGDFDMVNFLLFAEKSGFSGDCIVEVYSDAYESYGELFSSVDLLKNNYNKTKKSLENSVNK